MEPIEPPWQAVKEWIPDDEPDLDWFNRPRNPSNPPPEDFDQRPAWQPEEIPLFPRNPLFPALRSGPTAAPGASRQKQITSSSGSPDVTLTKSGPGKNAAAGFQLMTILSMLVYDPALDEQNQFEIGQQAGTEHFAEPKASRAPIEVAETQAFSPGDG